MNSDKWTNNQIAMVGAQASKFPTHEVVHWQALRAVPERVRKLIRDVNEKITQVENDKNLSAEGIKHKRAAIAHEAYDELNKLKEPAPAVSRRMETLSQKMSGVLTQGNPKDAIEGQVAGEIRAFVARQQSPVLAALKLKGDAQAVAAILGAPSFLSGLSDDEAATFRAQVLEGTEPAKEAAEIKKAIGVCSDAIKSAAAMITARANMRQRHDGTWEVLN
jgi:hypothetical protein